MAKVKLNEPVSYPEDEVTTINELDRRGLIEYTESKVWSKRTESGERIAYFACIKGTVLYWEIGKFAYESKTKGKVDLVTNKDIE